MFATDPHPSEYQLYLMAKAKREAEDAEKAAEAAVAKAKAAAKTRAPRRRAEARRKLALSDPQQCQPLPDHHIRSGSHVPRIRCSVTQRG